MTIRVIDIETTGVDPATDGICEVAWGDLGRAGYFTAHAEHLVNPGRPIPATASAVHHVVDKDVSEAKPMSEIAPLVAGATVYVAHNSRFEQAFLTPHIGEQTWLCTYRCALRLWPELPQHTNQVLRYHFGIFEPMGFSRAEVVPHRAMSDVRVTGCLLHRMLPLAPWPQLLQWSAEPALYSTLTFGKHKGTRYSDAPADYLEWIARQPDMDADTKHSATHWLDQRRRAA